MTKRYSIDTQAGILSYCPDEDTGVIETMRLDEAIEMLFYIKRREDDLRRMIFMSSPVTIRTPMHLVNSYWIGISQERRAVKVTAANWDEAMKTAERRVRSNWVHDRREDVAWKTGPVLVAQYDKDGRPMYPPAEDVSEADTPDYLVQDVLYKMRQPEYWQDRPENLDGRYVKTP